MANDGESKEPTRWDAILSRGKDIAALAKAWIEILTALAGISILFLIFSDPEKILLPLHTILSTLKEAGFTSVSFAGLEADLNNLRQAKATSNQLARSALANLETSRQTLESLRGAKLTQAEQQALSNAMQNTTLAIKTLNSATTGEGGSKEARAEATTSPKDGWLIVAGADITTDAAKDELKKAQETFPDSILLKRDGLYRTVIPFTTRQKAEERKQEASNVVNRDVFIVETSQWCPRGRSQATSKDGQPYQICQ